MKSFRPNSIIDLKNRGEMRHANDLGKSRIEIQSGKEGFGWPDAMRGAASTRGHPEGAKDPTMTALNTLP